MGWVDSKTNDVFDNVRDVDDNTMLFSENKLTQIPWWVGEPH